MKGIVFDVFASDSARSKEWENSLKAPVGAREIPVKHNLCPILPVIFDLL